jgi:hypothetical protein
LSFLPPLSPMMPSPYQDMNISDFYFLICS